MQARVSVVAEAQVQGHSPVERLTWDRGRPAECDEIKAVRGQGTRSKTRAPCPYNGRTASISRHCPYRRRDVHTADGGASEGLHFVQVLPLDFHFAAFLGRFVDGVEDFHHTHAVLGRCERLGVVEDAFNEVVLCALPAGLV